MNGSKHHVEESQFLLNLGMPKSKVFFLEMTCIYIFLDRTRRLGSKTVLRNFLLNVFSNIDAISAERAGHVLLCGLIDRLMSRSLRVNIMFEKFGYVDQKIRTSEKYPFSKLTDFEHSNGTMWSSIFYPSNNNGTTVL